MTKASDPRYRAATRRKLLCRSILVIAILFSPIHPALADRLHGQVVRVSDGDTVVVEEASGTRHKIRLLGIDAPESAQAYGPAASEFLRRRALGALATVHWQGRDRYQRLLGQVFVHSEDLGLAQIRAGLAWHYRAYAQDQAADDRLAYAAAELSARSEGQGLWADSKLTAPWDWRREFRSQQQPRPHRQNHSAATPQTPLPPPHWPD